MKCVNCGTAQPGGTMFCGQCGTRIDAAGGGQSGMDATQSILPASWGNQRQVNGYQPPSYGNQPPFGYQPPPYGNQPPYGSQPPPYGYQQLPPVPAARPARRGRTAVTAAGTAVLVLAVLGVAGGQAHWPPGVFGSKAAPKLAWSASKAPLPADAAGGSEQNAVLNDVACAAAGDCVAVGSYEAGSGSGAVPTGLVETLSHGSWAPAAVTDVTATAGGLAALVGISCPAAGSCVAVGDQAAGSNSKPSLVGEILAGGRWTASTPALPADADQVKWASLNDVSCPASGSCVATGRYTDQSGNSEGLLDTLSDGTWSAVKAPLPDGADPGKESSQFATVTLLTDVACPAVGTCVASGQYLDSAGAGQGVIETLSGGHWTAVKAPLPADAAASGQLAALWTIYCQAPGSCLAGGHYKSSGGQPRYLAETLSGGTWTTASIALPADAAPDQKWSKESATAVDGLSCQQAGSCVAAASFLARDGSVEPAVSTLSGGTWQTATLPLPAGAAKAGKQYAYPTLVACPASSSCVTTGAYNAADGSAQGLIETATPKQG